MQDSQSVAASTGPTLADRPWLSHYPAGVPANIDIPNLTLPQLLRDTAKSHGKNPAMVYYGAEYSYAELDKLSSQFANRLIELGLKPGEPVLLILPNVPQFTFAAFGVMKAGGISAALNPLLVEREILSLIKDSGARFVITLDRFWDRVEPIVKRGEIDVAIVTGPQDYLPTLKRLLYPLKFRDEMVKVEQQPKSGVYQLRKLMSGASSKDPMVPVDPNDPAVFQFTGGTTGIPKAAVLTHRNLVANATQIRTWITDLRHGEEVVMAVLPFFHSYGGTLCLYLGTLVAAKIVLVPRFDVGDVMELIEQYQPTIFPGVPTLYNALVGAVKDNPARQAAMRSIRFCVSGGAPLPPDVQSRFEEVTGGRLVEGFGLSEASPVTHVNPLDGRSRIGSVGLPLPNTEVKIVDLETREQVVQGERGEIVVRGPQVMRGYWGRVEETAQVLSEDGWLYTGDIGIMDEDGFFRIVDRQKDVIITGGENVYPREIEEVLYTHPLIREVCVAAVDHPVGGQVAKAFIVLEPGAELTRKDVLQFSSERLAKYKVPRLIEFRESLPKSAAGKIMRRELQEEEKAKGPRRRERRQRDEDDELLTAPEAPEPAVAKVAETADPVQESTPSAQS